MSAIEDIYNLALPHLEEQGFEDTLENRLALLQGWREGMDDIPASDEELRGKEWYMLVIDSEIFLLKGKIKWNIRN